MKMKIMRTPNGEPARPHSRLLSSLGIKAKRSLLSVTILAIMGAAAFALWPESRVEAHLAEAAADKIITTIIGGGYSSSAPAKQAPISLPLGVARDTQGRGLFFIDDVQGSRLLRFLNTTANTITIAGATILSGQIGLIAGGGDQDPVDGANPREVYLGGMNGMVVHPSGNAIFFGLPILTSGNVFAINLGTEPFTFGERPPVVPGKLAAITFATLPEMRTLALGPNDNKFYTISTCCGNQNSSPKVFKINSSGDTEVVAGGGTPPEGNGDGGPANQARLVNPTGIAFDSEGNLLITEGGSSQRTGGVRKVATDGTISSLVSDLGFISNYPVSITISQTGNIYVALGNGQKIVQVNSGGSLTTIAGDGSGFSCNLPANPTCGDGGPGTAAALNLPGSASELSYQTIQMATDANGVYIPDGQRGQNSGYSHIRYINRSASPVTIAGTTINPQNINSIAGNGKVDPFDGALAQYSALNSPHGVAVDANDNVFIMDTLNHRLRFVNRGAGPVTLFPNTPSAQTIPAGTIATLNRDVGEPIGDDRILTAFFDSLQGITVTANGVYIADAQNGVAFPLGPPAIKSGLVRFLNTSASTVTFYPGSAAPIAVPPGQVKVIGGRRPGVSPAPTDIGDGGPATSAVVFTGDIAVDAGGNIYVADYRANRIRRINANTGVITTLLEGLNKPTGIVFDPQGRLLVADTYNNRILRQNAAGSPDFTVIGDATLTPPINRPRDLVVDGSGRIYIANSGTNRVLQLVAPNQALGTTSAFAGSGAPGYGGDGGPAQDAQLAFPNPNTSEVNQPTIGIALLKNDFAVIFSDVNNHRIRQVTLEAPVALATNVSAASFAPGQPLAPESIVAVFGADLATGLALGGTIPLPQNLLGTTVKVKDSGAVERTAGLFFVSQNQVNYLLPPGTALGPATVTVTSGTGAVSVGTIQVANISPALFTVSNGTGPVAAYLLRYNGINLLGEEQIVTFNPGSGQFEPISIDLGPPDNDLYLVLYGTGIRNRSTTSAVVIKIGGNTLTTTYAGPASGYVGLDQLNSNPLPRTLIGAGLVNVEITVDGVATNVGTIKFK